MCYQRISFRIRNISKRDIKNIVTSKLCFANMNSQLCVNCRNEKPVNSTDNRLVTESCGHVKCMDCLLQEKSGCIACLSVKSRSDSAEASDADDGFGGDSGLCPAEITPCEFGDKVIIREIQLDEVEDLSKKKKLETSHIRLETGT